MKSLMNLSTKYGRLLASTMLVIGLAGCADLVVENTNDPNKDLALSRPDDVLGLIQGGYENWSLYSTAYQTSPLLVQADWFTSTVGNFWVNNAGHEPREAYPNTPTGAYPMVNEFHWTYYNRSVANANLALGAIAAGVVITDEATTLQAKAAAQLLQGILYGHLGLIFDQAFVIDENTDLTDQAAINLLPYNEVIDLAVAKLAEAKATAAAAQAAGSPGMSSDFIPELGPIDERLAGAGAIDWAEFTKIANSYAATFLAQSPRSTAEYAALDWAQIHTLATAGIDFDFAPISDDNNWGPLLYLYMNVDWFRVDMKIVNKLDPSQPTSWPLGSGALAPEPVSADQRYGAGKDYAYQVAWGPYNPARGEFKRTHVRYIRYNEFANGAVWDDPIPFMLKAQNDLIIAEAELNRAGGDLSNAIAKINDTRVGRGGLAALDGSTTAAQARVALEYEWDIEVGPTGVAFLSPWYNKRRWGQLQSGSMLHLPVPARELGSLLMEFYTFGGGGEGSAPKSLGKAIRPIK